MIKINTVIGLLEASGVPAISDGVARMVRAEVRQSREVMRRHARREREAARQGLRFDFNPGGAFNVQIKGGAR